METKQLEVYALELKRLTAYKNCTLPFWASSFFGEGLVQKVFVVLIQVFQARNWKDVVGLC
jgi:hypothetical protein